MSKYDRRTTLELLQQLEDFALQGNDCELDEATTKQEPHVLEDREKIHALGAELRRRLAVLFE